jgi:16S rRNA (guanine(966)-N(2))-methyltransferase RsmD
VSDAGRVIAGSAKGMRLTAPPGEGTRPLTGRVKETLFAILDPELEGASVLDLFAGSGAAGIEALSRGAASATFIERDRRAAGTIGENLRRARLDDRGRVRAMAVERYLAEPDDGPFDVVFLDAPYEDVASLGAALTALGEPSAPLRTDAAVVAKHFWRDAPPARIGLLASERDRRFGETSLTFYRRQAAGPDGG